MSAPFGLVGGEQAWLLELQGRRRSRQRRCPSVPRWCHSRAPIATRAALRAGSLELERWLNDPRASDPGCKLAGRLPTGREKHRRVLSCGGLVQCRIGARGHDSVTSRSPLQHRFEAFPPGLGWGRYGRAVIDERVGDRVIEGQLLAFALCLVPCRMSVAAAGAREDLVVYALFQGFGCPRTRERP